jgi:hypothetical protein
MKALEYYKTQSPVSDPKDFSKYFDALPSSTEELVKVVQGLIIDKDLIELYETTILDYQKDDMDSRYISIMLSIILERDDSPLIQERQPNKRFVGSCRDYALLLCSILRHKGIPARLRCGFDNYFNIKEGLYDDHWICEYWEESKNRWVKVDANVDRTVKQKYHITVDTLDLKSNEFLVAGQAWRMARKGQADPNSFGVSSIHIQGLWFIRGSIVRDMAVLNKFESLPWDYWGIANKDPEDFPESDLNMLDVAARLSETAEPFESIEATNNLEAFTVPLEITSYSPSKGENRITIL